MLRFLVPLPSLRARVLLAAGMWIAGLALWSAAPGPGAIGLLLVALGHLPLWVRRQTTAPGGATPRHEEMWAPVEDAWLERVEALERRGEAWDATPWDLSNVRGCLGLAAVLAVVGGGLVAAGLWLGFEAPLLLAAAVPVLVVPLWLNGMRSTWNPSELRKKGLALAAARQVPAPGFEPVPMLALRDGPRGKYPVDAKLMLRPREDDGTGFLGVQVQVAMNNVQGTDYPYLYAVVLGKHPFALPLARGRHRRPGGRVELVYERGKSEGVDFLVIRQHADNAGGWHTTPDDVAEIVTVALAEARQAWEANRMEKPA